MPPWFANPEYGHFLNDRRLRESEIQTLIAWAGAGKQCVVVDAGDTIVAFALP